MSNEISTFPSILTFYLHFLFSHFGRFVPSARRRRTGRLEKLCAGDCADDALKDELSRTIEMLENDTKTFEDLEFQYLEEETEWLAYREELHSEQKALLNNIDEKRSHIRSLEIQGIDNQNTACADTKTIEKSLFTMLNNLEKYREKLKTLDGLLYAVSGQQCSPPDSDDECHSGHVSAGMSQSLFGSQEILSANSVRPHSHRTKSADLMSKSLNENHFSNKIETLPLNSVIDSLRASTVSVGAESADNGDDAMASPEECADRLNDPLQKLKYNLSPPFEHKNGIDAQTKAANLNLSIESDDFEVNPLEKRVPSQDDIDRICKITNDAPISTQGASYKVIESIKEIERNRQLLLTQQGSQVIEHERQKMNELKKKCHDEARAQYLQLQNHSDKFVHR